MFWMSSMKLTAEPAATSFQRHHRLRRTPALRSLVRETRLDPRQLVLPVFIDARAERPEPISSLAGQFRWPVSQIDDIAGRAARAGIGGLMLFGLPLEKDPDGNGAADPLGPVPAALRALRGRYPELAL